MEHSSPLIAGVGLADRARKSRWPAKLDVTQSATGLVLVLFMWAHMFFVSSILLGKEAMWTITRLFEGYFFFGTSYPWLVSIAVGVVILLIIVHAMLDYGTSIPIAENEWLTIAARDNNERIGGDDPYDVTTIVLRVKGSDLAAFKSGRITRDEAVKRVSIKDY